MIWWRRPVLTSRGWPLTKRKVPTTSKRQSRYCIVKAHDSLTQRLESTLPKEHEEDIEVKRYNSTRHYNLVHECVPVLKRFNSRIRTGRSSKGCGRCSWPMWRVQRRLFLKHKKQKTYRFDTLMYICHIKNTDLEPKYQMYEGRIVLRGDILNDDSGARAVFTGQDPSASLQDYRLCRKISSKDGGCTKIAENSKFRMSTFLERNLYRHPLAVSCEKDSSMKFCC